MVNMMLSQVLRAQVLQVWLFLLLLFPFEALASYLRIEGEPKLEVSCSDQTCSVSGSYRIVNQGDEIARNVHPSLRLGNWFWVGESIHLDKGNDHSWSINEKFTQVDLSGADEGSPKIDLDLPLKGMLPLLILLHYEDNNGYKFSAPKMLEVKVGEVTDSEVSRVRAQKLTALLEPAQGHKNFKLKLNVYNPFPKRIRARISWHHSQELIISNDLPVIDIAPKENKIFSFEGTNFSGIIGSSYQVYGIIEWNESGIRNTQSAVGPVSINERDRTPIIISVLVGLIALSCFSLYFFVFRGGDKNKPR